jgi:hypothetical protein
MGVNFRIARHPGVRPVEAVESFTRGASQADDITVLLVRYRALAQAAPAMAAGVLSPA